MGLENDDKPPQADLERTRIEGDSEAPFSIIDEPESKEVILSLENPDRTIKPGETVEIDLMWSNEKGTTNVITQLGRLHYPSQGGPLILTICYKKISLDRAGETVIEQEDGATVIKADPRQTSIKETVIKIPTDQERSYQVGRGEGVDIQVLPYALGRNGSTFVSREQFEIQIGKKGDVKIHHKSSKILTRICPSNPREKMLRILKGEGREKPRPLKGVTVNHPRIKIDCKETTTMSRKLNYLKYEGIKTEIFKGMPAIEITQINTWIAITFDFAIIGFIRIKKEGTTQKVELSFKDNSNNQRNLLRTLDGRASTLILGRGGDGSTADIRISLDIILSPSFSRNQFEIIVTGDGKVRVKNNGINKMSIEPIIGINNRGLIQPDQIEITHLPEGWTIVGEE